MRFSVWTRPNSSYADTLAIARYADEAGWYGLWFADHYMSDSRDGSPTDAAVLEVFTVLPALAASVARLRLGNLVSPTTFHHPALLAKRAATLDQLSGGRFTLGLGAGWQVNEHKAYGVDLLSAKDRVDRFEEAITIVRSLLTNARTTVTGKHFTVTDAPCEPKPVQNPLPILVGTGGARMQKITARHAQAWNCWGTPATVATKSAQLDRACDAVGRDRATIRRTAQPMLFFADTDEAAAKIRASAPADRTIVGSSEYIAEQVGAYEEAGVDELILPDFSFGATVEDRLANYDRFWTEVAVHFPAA